MDIYNSMRYISYLRKPQLKHCERPNQANQPLPQSAVLYNKAGFTRVGLFEGRNASYSNPSASENAACEPKTLRFRQTPSTHVLALGHCLHGEDRKEKVPKEVQ